MPMLFRPVFYLHIIIPFFLFCSSLWSVLSEKTLCEKKLNKMPSGIFYYQRTEANGTTECAEHCIENWQYCRSVLVINEMDKFLCHLYGISLEHLVPLNLNSYPDQQQLAKNKSSQEITLIELMDPPCSSKFSLNASSLLLASISSMTKSILAMIPRPSTQKKFFNEPLEDQIDGAKKLRKEKWNDEREGKEADVENNEEEGRGWERGKEKKANIGTIVDEDKVYRTGLPTPKSDHDDENDVGEGQQHQHRHYPIGLQANSPSSLQFRSNYMPKGIETNAESWQIRNRCRTGGFCNPNVGFFPRQLPSQPYNLGPTPHHHAPCAARKDTDPCAPQPHWLEWTEGSCSVTCGNGKRERHRYCSSGIRTDCAGEDTDIERCAMPACNQWSEWTGWGRCSASCGGGKTTRRRICRNGNECKGASQESKPCNEQDCPTWAEWGAWSHCSASCGPGMQKRTRECVPSSEECAGRATDVRECELRACPSWGEWEAWSSCSKSCGNGESVRHRECTNGLADECRGPAVEHLLCNTQPCPAWTPWTEWGGCSKSCGRGGTKLRSRQCRYNGLPSEECPGAAQDQMECALGPCPSWAEWSKWTECSTTCGHGQQQRTRECTPAGFGCAGGDREVRFCQRAVCPYFDNWTEWSGCSVTCGVGFCERRRRCITDGDLGEKFEEETDEKSTGGNLGREEAFSHRNRKKMGSAEEGRTRTEEGRKGGGGTHSGGQPEDITAHSVLSAQTLQVAQSAVALGIDSRRRSPVRGLHSESRSPLRDNGTGECFGPDVERKSCDAGPCCEWTAWSPWSDCHVRCGNAGIRERTRDCKLEERQGQQEQQDENYSTGWRAAGRFGTQSNSYSYGPSYGRPFRGANGLQCSICVGESRQTESCAIPAEVENRHCETGEGKRQRIKPKARKLDDEEKEGEGGRGRGGGGEEEDGKGRKGGTDRETYAGLALVKRDDPNAKAGDGNNAAGRRGEKTEREGKEEEEEECYWTEWTEWSGCETAMSKRSRKRMCSGLRVLINGCQCQGDSVEQGGCLETNGGQTTDMGAASSKPALPESLIKQFVLIPRHSATNRAEEEVGKER